ncbi:DUF1127 domain-containing protein [Aquabacter cavernae]|uniref:DUF1127 domain-containing protein n=1 Tax=Aquabacter cavernae TaxID=2496029 RepID=UPI001FDF2DDD|nr:DUF1127 domain-containing protein [Aquabacter cavernae]
MTTMSTHPVREARLFGRFGAMVSDFVAAVGEARQMAAEYKHLTRLSDTDLARIGLTREEIPQAVVRGH